ncbi:hypothetical protein FHX16_000186 [Rhizobium sp. BK661]|nr:hypothetical protein [Rhizobium sp. BK661]
MSIEGLWIVEFSSPGGEGSGTVVFSNGRLLGGDGSYYYSGHYSLKDSQITATLTANHYSGPLSNVFGPLRTVTLSLQGAVGGDLIMAQGISKGPPTMRGSFRLRRVEAL